jgi:hypothetical protein
LYFEDPRRKGKKGEEEKGVESLRWREEEMRGGGEGGV